MDYIKIAKNLYDDVMSIPTREESEKIWSKVHKFCDSHEGKDWTKYGTYKNLMKLLHRYYNRYDRVNRAIKIVSRLYNDNEHLRNNHEFCDIHEKFVLIDINFNGRCTMLD